MGVDYIVNPNLDQREVINNYRIIVKHITKETKKAINQYQYFEYHLSRCKKTNDKIKICLKLILIKAYIVCLRKMCHKLIDEMLPPVRQIQQKLLN